MRARHKERRSESEEGGRRRREIRPPEMMEIEGTKYKSGKK